MAPQKTARRTGDRAAARRRRAETCVQRASHMSENQLWKCARVLHAIATLAHTVEQREALDARAERAEGLAWDKALRHQVDHADLP
jgi:hypothetical protein